MRFSNGIKAITAAAALAAAFAVPAFAAGEAHQHGSIGEAKLVLDHGRKWQTDAPLRQGMENIRAALAAEREAIHAGKAGAERYDALAGKVAGEVTYIVQNCKLPEDADAQLHLVIAEILEGTEAMQGKAPGVTRRAGAERVANTLDRYASFFDHPGWEKL